MKKLLLSTIFTGVLATSASAQEVINFFYPNDTSGAIGFLGLTNLTSRSATVTLSGRDDTGTEAAGGNITVELGANTQFYISSSQLENGHSDINTASGSFGNGSGFWHITASSTGQVGIQNLLWANDSSLGEINRPIEENSDFWDVIFFSQEGYTAYDLVLRIANNSNSSGTVSFSAVDQNGNTADSSASLSLGPYEAQVITSADLGAGNSSKGLTGTIADGAGFWKLRLYSALDLGVYAYSTSPTGQVSDVSNSVTVGVNSTASIGLTNPDPCNDFQDVKPNANNSEYPDPSLDVSCTTNAVTVTSNNIPNFEFVQTTPTALEELERTYRFPRNPEIASSTTEVPDVGSTGVAINGMAIYAPNEAPSDGYRDPILDELLDYCNGHTGANIYHFHANPKCLVEDQEGRHSLLLGYALDGFPLLAPYECTDTTCSTVNKVKSSYRYVGGSDNAYEANEYVAGLGDLDECNGMTRPDGSYAYYATDFFPYTYACYKGSTLSNNGGGASQ